jgi:glutamine synthetase
MSIAGPNTVLNATVADVLQKMADKLETADNFDKAVDELIHDTLKEHQKVIFNGNGYSDEWVAEAEKRGLPNTKTMVDATESLVDEKTVAMFERQHVYSRTELEARAEINYEAYSKAINIEARTMLKMAAKQYIPSVISYVTSLAESINSISAACPTADVSVQSDLLTKCSSLLAEAQKALAALKEAVDKASGMEEGKEQAEYFRDVVFTAMADLRKPIDTLEDMVDKDYWPVPAYGDMLFEV